MMESVINSPYRGLTPYTEADAAYFFGRTAEIGTITANLEVARLTLLYGPSGVGKTSVLRAGVLHGLQQQARANQVALGCPEIIPVYFSGWQGEPLLGLTQQIYATTVQLYQGAPNVPDLLVGPTPPLLPLLAQIGEQTASDLLIILDQFEEYFLYHPNESGPDSFAHHFIQVVNSSHLRANFLLSLREDALARLDYFKGRIPTLLDNRLSIGHLDRTAGHEAVVKPLERFNQDQQTTYTIEPSLVTAVLDQVGSGQVTLSKQGAGGRTETNADRIEAPYLQLVLTRIGEQEQSHGSTCLRQTTLDDLGGAVTIVRNYLDDTMDALSPAERDLSARFFDRLVTPSGTKIALTLAELIYYAATEPTVVGIVLQELQVRRLLRPVQAPNGVVQYEIFHDVLAAAVLDWQERYQAVQFASQHLIQKRQWEQRLLSELWAFPKSQTINNVAQVRELATELLKKVQLYTQCSYAILFANTQEDDNILIPFAQKGISQFSIDHFPHFNWRKVFGTDDMIRNERSDTSDLQQKNIMQNGIRGENKYFFADAVFAAIATIDNQYRSVLIFGPFNERALFDLENEFLAEIGRIIGQKILIELKMLNLQFVQKRWREHNKFLIHLARTALTPIVAQIGVAQRLLPVADTDPKFQLINKALEGAYALALRLGSGLSEISDSPPLLLEREDMKFERYPLSPLIVNCVNNFKDYAQQLKRQFVIHEDIEQLPNAEIDVIRLYIAISNIIDIAVKYACPNTEIHIRARLDKNEIDFASLFIEVAIESDKFPLSELVQIIRLGINRLTDEKIKNIPPSIRGLVETYTVIKAHQGKIQVTLDSSDDKLQLYGIVFGFSLPLNQGQ